MLSLLGHRPRLGWGWRESLWSWGLKGRRATRHCLARRFTVKETPTTPGCGGGKWKGSGGGGRGSLLGSPPRASDSEWLRLKDFFRTHAAVVGLRIGSAPSSCVSWDRPFGSQGRGFLASAQGGVNTKCPKEGRSQRWFSQTVCSI